MRQREPATYTTVGTAATPRPTWKGKRSDEDAARANPDVQGGEARRSRAAIEYVDRFVFVLVEHADDKIHPTGDVGVHQPRGGGAKHSS